MKSITFNYRCMIQARFVSLMAKKTGQAEVDIAIAYGERLAKKINSKYQVIPPVNIRRSYNG